MPHELLFQRKLEAQQLNSPNLSLKKLWVDVIIYSIIISIVVSSYFFIQRGQFSLLILNRVFADVGMLLIGLSFALSGICYYWNFADHFISYRKQLGVVGFSYVLVHTLITLLFLPKFFPFPGYFISSENILTFICAVIAVIIYAGIVVISTKYVIHEIGGAMWRKLLRVGYIAYFLSILHFGLQSYPYWWNWFIGKGNNVLPSFGLFVFLFGIIVMALRGFLWLSLLNQKKEESLPNNDGQQNT